MSQAHDLIVVDGRGEFEARLEVYGRPVEGEPPHAWTPLLDDGPTLTVGERDELTSTTRTPPPDPVRRRRERDQATRVHGT